MKKIISLALCLVLGSFVLAGCSDSSEPFEEKSYTPDTQVREINLDAEDREIEVSLSPDEQVHIEYWENSKEYYEIAVSDGVLTMTSASRKVGWIILGESPPPRPEKYRCKSPTPFWKTLPCPQPTRTSPCRNCP